LAYVMRTLEELVNTQEPAWPLLQEWLAKAKRPVEVLPPSGAAGPALTAMQVTTRSPLGAVIYNTGGMFVDHGWIRVLGSGHPRLPRALHEWNFSCGLKPADTAPKAVLVADDVLGGFFALNGGRFAPKGNTVWYFAPDTLEWEDLGKAYSDFLWWCFTGDLDGYYRPYRWAGWERDVAMLPGEKGLFVYPPLSTKGPAIDHRRRGIVPVAEMFKLHAGSI